MSYDLEVTAPAPPDWRALRDLVGLDDLRARPEELEEGIWPDGGLRIWRVGRSVRMTDADWKAGRLRVTVRALPSPDDCDLALRLIDAAARLVGAAKIEADYFPGIEIGELRRFHTADWMREQAESGTRVMATLIREGRGPMGMPGPNRTCYIGTRLLAELEAAGPPETLYERVLATMRRVQWDVPADFRDAGVFVSGGDDGQSRETRFAVWLPDENLVIPRVDYVALRVPEGGIVMVPFDAVAALAGPHGALLDECQLLIRAVGADEWKAVIARARPLAKSPRK